MARHARPSIAILSSRRARNPRRRRRRATTITSLQGAAAAVVTDVPMGGVDVVGRSPGRLTSETSGSDSATVGASTAILKQRCDGRDCVFSRICNERADSERNRRHCLPNMRSLDTDIPEN